MKKYLPETRDPGPLINCLSALILLLILGVAYTSAAEPEPLTCPAPVDEVDCYDLAPGVYICTDPEDFPTYSI
jgi:hypothetical protein